MLVPTPDLFVHPSRIHGQRHVARVMIHAFRLIEATGLTHLATWPVRVDAIAVEFERILRDYQ